MSDWIYRHLDAIATAGLYVEVAIFCVVFVVLVDRMEEAIRKL